MGVAAIRAGLATAVLAGLATSSSSQERALGQPRFDPVLAALRATERDRAERELNETLIRMSVHRRCGGDADLRCQQFASRSDRGIDPTIAVRDIACVGRERYPEFGTKRCTFAVGNPGQRAIACSIVFREVVGDHSRYWSDDLPYEPAPAATPGDVPSMPLGRSSLRCDGDLRRLTAAPAPIDPAPAVPARPLEPLAEIAATRLYVTPTIPGWNRTMTMQWRIGAHGRIDTCAVVPSSGQEGSDYAACGAFRAFARFEPARDARGRSVASAMTYRFRWPEPR